MSRSPRAALIAAVFVVALAAASSGAHAALSVRPGATTLTSTNATITTGRSVVTCRTLTIRATITSAGAATVPLGGVAAAGCAVNGIAVVIQQTLVWLGAISVLLVNGQIVGVRLDLTLPVGAVVPPLTLPLGALRVTFLNCTFDLAGTVTALTPISPVTPPAWAVVPAFNFNAAPGLAVTLASAGCAVFGIVNGTPFGFSALLALNPALQVTLM